MLASLSNSVWVASALTGGIDGRCCCLRGRILRNRRLALAAPARFGTQPSSRVLAMTAANWNTLAAGAATIAAMSGAIGWFARPMFVPHSAQIAVDPGSTTARSSLDDGSKPAGASAAETQAPSEADIVAEPGQQGLTDQGGAGEAPLASKVDEIPQTPMPECGVQKLGYQSDWRGYKCELYKRIRKAKLTMDVSKATITGSCLRKDIGQNVRARAASIRECYALELVVQPELAVTILSKWTITGHGRVEGLMVTGDARGSEGLADCLQQTLRRITFMRPDEGVCAVEFPLSFKPH